MGKWMDRQRSGTRESSHEIPVPLLHLVSFFHSDPDSWPRSIRCRAGRRVCHPLVHRPVLCWHDLFRRKAPLLTSGWPSHPNADISALDSGSPPHRFSEQDGFNQPRSRQEVREVQPHSRQEICKVPSQSGGPRRTTFLPSLMVTSIELTKPPPGRDRRYRVDPRGPDRGVCGDRWTRSWT